MANGFRDIEKIIDMFDSVFRDDWPSALLSKSEAYEQFYSVANFPPTDLYVREENKNWVFEFALAFYNEDEIEISFNGDYMHLKANKKANEANNGKKYIHHGIKSAEINNRYYVPIAKFDSANATASFKNGILKVEIPIKPEHQPKKLAITA